MTRRTTRAKVALVALLFLIIGSTSEASYQRPVSVWSNTLSVHPAAFHYSQSENLLYVLGHNPERIVSLKPEDGSIVDEVDVGSVTGLLSVRNVAIREGDNAMKYAILTVETGMDGTDGSTASRLVCWDFASRMPSWEFNVTSTGMSLPSAGNQHFARGEVYAFNTMTGEVLWKKKFLPMAGWTYLNGFLYGGILTEVGGSSISPGIYQINAQTGAYVSFYRTPNLCFEQGSTFLAPSGRATQQRAAEANCNNIWSNSVPSKSGEFLYVMDDLFGLMKLNASDISAGPIWSNAFARDNDWKSQQTYFSPVVSPDDRVVYASAYWTTVAIDALDGATIWTLPQESSWLTGAMVLSPYGDSIFLPYNFSVHKIDASSGAVEFATDPSLLSRLVTFNEGANLFFTVGVGVEAYESKIVAPVIVVNGATGSTSAGAQSVCGIAAVLFAAVACLGI